MSFNAKQVAQLLQPINPVRVLKDGKNNSHVSQQDVVAHLIRVFGFGNFTTELLNIEQVFETPHGDSADPKCRWTVGYRAVMRLTIYNDKHEPTAFYEDASVGDAQNLVRQEAHDLAMKSAISLAKKRCAINLGDQFGLSLYNKGQMTALVKGTLVVPKGFEKDVPDDVQKDVPQQVTLGTDETVHNDHEANPTEVQEKILSDSLGATKVEEEQQ